MQKKLLLVFMAVNCAMIHATEIQEALSGEGQKSEFSEVTECTPGLARALAEQEAILRKAELVEKELTDYKTDQYLLFKAALVKALSDNSKAIDELFEANAKEYKEEEEDSKNLQDDSSAGFTGSYATPKSRNGIILQYFLKRKESKALINTEFKTIFTDHKIKFNNLIMPILEKKVVHNNYEMSDTFLQGLDDCGDDRECLLEHNIHWPIEEDFLDRFNFAAVKPVIKEVRNNNIPLTDDDIIMIAQKKVFLRGEKKLSMKSCDDSKKKVLAKLNDILHPKQDGAGDDRQD